MRRLIATVLFLCVSVPLYAQHADVVAAVKASLQAKGVDLSGACGSLQITKRVAWQLRGEGAGLLDKPAGNQCEGRAVDIIAYVNGSIVDILTDSGGGNGPSWQIGAPVDPSRWRPVTSDPDAGAPPVTPPPVIVVPPVVQPPLVVDVGAIMQKLDALSLQLKEHDSNPGWLAKVLGNRWVQIALTGFGTCAASPDCRATLFRIGAAGSAASPGATK